MKHNYVKTNECRPTLSAAQKCRPMTLVSGNIRCMRILAGVPLGRGPQMRVGWLTTAIFGDLSGSSSETSEVRPAILYDDMLPLVGL